MAPGESWETVWSRENPSGFLHNVGVFLARYGDLQRITFTALKRTGKLEGTPAVLEVGCGTAPVPGMLEKYSGSLFGVDVSLSSAVRSREKCLSAVADGRTLPFADSSFDIVFSSGVMDMFDDSNAALFLEEMNRVLKPSGRIVAVNARTGCRLHRVIMEHLEKRNRWRYGKKRTFSSLSGILPDKLKIVRENGRGAVFQLRFVSYLFENRELLRRLYHLVFLLFSLILYPLNSLPGAVLVTEMEKM